MHEFQFRCRIVQQEHQFPNPDACCSNSAADSLQCSVINTWNVQLILKWKYTCLIAGIWRKGRETGSTIRGWTVSRRCRDTTWWKPPWKRSLSVSGGRGSRRESCDPECKRRSGWAQQMWEERRWSEQQPWARLTPAATRIWPSVWLFRKCRFTVVLKVLRYCWCASS